MTPKSTPLFLVLFPICYENPVKSVQNILIYREKNCNCLHNAQNDTKIYSIVSWPYSLPVKKKRISSFITLELSCKQTYRHTDTDKIKGKNGTSLAEKIIGKIRVLKFSFWNHFQTGSSGRPPPLGLPLNTLDFCFWNQ